MSQTATHQEPIEHKNELVEVVVLKQPHCRVEFRVKAHKPLIVRAKKESAKEVGKEVTIPGFRKGKASEDMILKKYGSEVERRLPNKLADLAFNEAEKMAKIPLLNNNSKVTFDPKNISADSAELIFHFETEPHIPEIVPANFVQQEIKKAEVGEKQIEEAIRQTQFFFAEWIPVEDRPVKDHDTVIIDLDTVEENGALTRVFNQVRFEVSKERMAEWMYKLMIGANLNDTLEGMSEPDSDLTEVERAEFKPKKVIVKVLKIEEAKLPVVDDDFAKKVGATDAAKMRQMITDMLTSQSDHAAKEQLREQVSHFLLKDYPFELPHSLIKTEKEHRMHQLMQSPKFKRDWEKKTAEERAAFDEKIWNESADAVRLFYLSRQMINQAKISISRGEVQKMAIDTLREGNRGQRIDVDQIPKEMYALAFSKVMLVKAQDFILEHKNT